MNKAADRNPARRGRDWLVLLGFILACLGIAALGGAITSLSVASWYPTLIKPAFNPPAQVFAPVWTVLYVLMAISAWRVWCQPQSARRTRALALFVVQLALNFAWSCLFFGLMAVAAAFIEIVLLWLAIVATALSFARIDRTAGWLMVPYAIWVLFAAVLNGAIWWLN